jgi:hypothetical protein
MKIIKSLSLIAVGLFVTTLLHAQQDKNNQPPQLKAEVLKQQEIKTPPQAGLMNTPSPQPGLKPQPGTPLPKEAAATTNTQPQQSEEGKSKVLPKPKNAVLDNSTEDDTKKLTPEQTNILNGKSERPKNSGVQAPKSSEQKTMQVQPVKQTDVKQQQ